MKRLSHFIIPIILLCYAYACKDKKEVVNYLTYTSTATEIRAIDNKIARVYAMLLGHFSNQPQSDTTSSTLYRQQEVVSVPIWRKRRGEYWFYMGRFKTGIMEQAIWEGIYQLQRRSVDTLVLQFHPLPTGDYSEEWRKPLPFDEFEPIDLVRNQDCVSYVLKNNDTTFEIHPGEHSCPHSIAYHLHYFSFGARITPDYQEHFPSFYNENDELMIGYKRPHGLRFERLPKSIAEED